MYSAYIYNHKYNGLDVTYCCNFGKQELYCVLSTRKQMQSCCLAIHLITYLFTPWSKVLLEKLSGSQIVRKFLAFYGTRSLNTAFTYARHLSLPWASSNYSMAPHPKSLSSILILSFQLRMGLPSGLFIQVSPTKTLRTTLYSPIRATCPAHLISLNLIPWTILGEQYISLRSCGFLHSPVTSSLLRPNMIQPIPCWILSHWQMSQNFKIKKRNYNNLLHLAVT